MRGLFDDLEEPAAPAPPPKQRASAPPAVPVAERPRWDALLLDGLARALANRAGFMRWLQKEAARKPAPEFGRLAADCPIAEYLRADEQLHQMVGRLNSRLEIGRTHVRLIWPSAPAWGIYELPAWAAKFGEAIEHPEGSRAPLPAKRALEILIKIPEAR